MSEKEKKAIEDLIKEIIILRENSNKIIDSKELLNYKETLLKLITRQKQELEKEKEKNKRLEKFIENGEHTWKQKYNETFKYVEDEFVSKDKIKAKIEEVQNMKAKAKDIVFKSSLNYIETELQSLLEKE